MHLLQQLETIQKSIEPLQDGILKLSAIAAATTNEASLRELDSSLEEFRKSEREMRERLFVIQVAKKYDWEAANKMARRKAGEYDDPELAKVLEEREKRDEREKKEKARLATSMKAKRGGRFFGGAGATAFRGGVPRLWIGSGNDVVALLSRFWGHQAGFGLLHRSGLGLQASACLRRQEVPHVPSDRAFLEILPK